MPIGEFAGAAAAPEQDGLVLATPMYWFYEMSRAALNPFRAVAEATRLFYKNPLNPLASTDFGKITDSVGGPRVMQLGARIRF